MYWKIAILIPFCFISGVFAQSPFENRCPSAITAVQGSRDNTIANDFTITTTDGITRNLYNTLDSGKTVFIDLFYTTCYYCQLYSPIVEEIYQNSGAGQTNIEFWGISNNLFDPDSIIDQYRLNYNVTNPCAGPDGGGTTAFSIIIDGQNFLGFPTYCVVCPDRTLYFDPCYPPTLTGFDPYFEQCGAFIGIEEEKPGASNNSILSIYPIPATDILTLEIFPNQPGPVSIVLYNLLGKKVSSYSYEIGQESKTINIPVDILSPGTFYLLMIQNGDLIGSRKVLVSGR